MATRRDPIGYAGGANLYGYCGSGPVGRMDANGLSWTDKVLVWLLGGQALGDGNMYGNGIHKGLFGGNAVTLGSVTIYPEGYLYEGTDWWRHEEVHKKQWACLGDAFLLVYGAGAVLGGLKGDCHDGNPLEVEADRAATGGGYGNAYDDGKPIWGLPASVEEMWRGLGGGR